MGTTRNTDSKGDSKAVDHSSDTPTVSLNAYPTTQKNTFYKNFSSLEKDEHSLYCKSGRMPLKDGIIYLFECHYFYEEPTREIIRTTLFEDSYPISYDEDLNSNLKEVKRCHYKISQLDKSLYALFYYNGYPTEVKNSTEKQARSVIKIFSLDTRSVQRTITFNDRKAHTPQMGVYLIKDTVIVLCTATLSDPELKASLRDNKQFLKPILLPDQPICQKTKKDYPVLDIYQKGSDIRATYVLNCEVDPDATLQLLPLSSRIWILMTSTGIHQRLIFQENGEISVQPLDHIKSCDNPDILDSPLINLQASIHPDIYFSFRLITNKFSTNLYLYEWNANTSTLQKRYCINLGNEVDTRPLLQFNQEIHGTDLVFSYQRVDSSYNSYMHVLGTPCVERSVKYFLEQCRSEKHALAVQDTNFSADEMKHLTSQFSLENKNDSNDFASFSVFVKGTNADEQYPLIKYVSVPIPSLQGIVAREIQQDIEQLEPLLKNHIPISGLLKLIIAYLHHNTENTDPKTLVEQAKFSANGFPLLSSPLRSHDQVVLDCEGRLFSRLKNPLPVLDERNVDFLLGFQPLPKKK